MKRLAFAAALAAASLLVGALPALAAQGSATTQAVATASSNSGTLLTTALCYGTTGRVEGTLSAYGQGNKATSFVVRLNSGTVGGDYALWHGTKSTSSALVGTATLKPDYSFAVDTSASPIALSPGRLKSDTFRVNGPGWGETYVDCKV